MSPVGTFTRKAQRHPGMPRKASMPAKNPPIAGPSTAAAMYTPLNQDR